MKDTVLMDGKCFLSVQCEGYITIFLKGDCDPEHVEEFCSYLKKDIEYSNQHILINCELLTSITVDWIKPLLFLQMQLCLFHKKMRLVGMNEIVLHFFKTLGAEKAFVLSGLKEALFDFGITTKKIIDRNIINPFIMASSEILQSKYQVKSRPGQIFFKKSCGDFLGDITCIIPVVEEQFSGAISISFPESTILKFMSSIHGMDEKLLIEVDALSNLILNRARSELLRRGYTLQSICPAIVTGKESPFVASLDRIVVIPVESCAGKYYLELIHSAEYKTMPARKEFLVS